MAAWAIAKASLTPAKLQTVLNGYSKDSTGPGKTAKRKKTQNKIPKTELIRRFESVWADLSCKTIENCTLAAEKATVPRKKGKKAKTTVNNDLNHCTSKVISCLNSDGSKNTPKIHPDGVCLYRGLQVVAFPSKGHTNLDVKHLIQYNVTIRHEIETKKPWVGAAHIRWRSDQDVNDPRLKEKAKQLLAAVIKHDMPDSGVRAVQGHYCIRAACWGGMSDFDTIVPSLAFRDGQFFPHPLFLVGADAVEDLRCNTVVNRIIMTTPADKNAQNIGQDHIIRMWATFPSKIISLDEALWMAAIEFPGVSPRILRYVGNHYEVNILQPKDMQVWTDLSKLKNFWQGAPAPRPIWTGTYIRQQPLEFGS